ncbi:MAG: twin-arginine translocase subunit TatC [Dysgonamonadaceae bacterium]|jgi:sec-independent protein translocase protein TatC|nr:twin-arginine translocase subunit TatC [Dysgonamonadaceae bacterium]
MSDQDMTFWDHLEEFRWVLFRIVIALLVFAVAGFVVMPWVFDHIILAPAKPDFFMYEWMCRLSQSVSFIPDFCDTDLEIKLVNLDLTAPFFRHLSTSFWLAIVLICPYILFEVWRFIRPALYAHEKRNVRWVFIFGSIMFFVGCSVGYSLIFPTTFRFLYTYSGALSETIQQQVSLDSYMDNFLILVLAMGLVFELPLISWLLSQIGILRKSFFSTYRRHAIVALLIAAAIITPTGDPFTLALFFFPLYGLYELSIFFVKPDDKKT